MSSYFIDYENVRVSGFQGLENLTQEDKVYIFYTENADTMTFGLHHRLQESPAQIYYVRVAAGRNALDFQLASYLGYCIAQAPEEGYVVISRDNGFVPLVHFWGEKSIQLEMRPSLGRSASAEEEYTFRGGRKPVSFLNRGRREALHKAPAEPERPKTGGVETVPAETVGQTASGDAAQQPAVRAETEGKEPASTQDTVKTARPVKKAKSDNRRRTAGNKKTPETDSLFETVLNTIAYPDKAQTVWKYVTKYKTKQGLNNALVKEYGSDIAGEIYKSIKPLLADKKAK